MADRPPGRKFCSTCGQPMKWFGDHWLCTSIKVHDLAVLSRRSGGK